MKIAEGKRKNDNADDSRNENRSGRSEKPCRNRIRITLFRNRIRIALFVRTVEEDLGDFRLRSRSGKDGMSC